MGKEWRPHLPRSLPLLQRTLSYYQLTLSCKVIRPPWFVMFGFLDPFRRNQIIRRFIVLQYFPPLDALADDHILEEYGQWQIHKYQVIFGGVLTHCNAVHTAWSFQGASTCRKPSSGGFSAEGLMLLTNWTSRAGLQHRSLWSQTETLRYGFDTLSTLIAYHILSFSHDVPGLYWLSNPRFHEDC